MNTHHLFTLLHQKGIYLSVVDGKLAFKAEKGVIKDDDILLLKQHKSELIALIESMDDNFAAIDAPVRLQRTLPYECQASPAQQRMMFMETLAGGQSYYNIPIAYQIHGQLNLFALTHALCYLVNKHDVLRTTYQNKNGDFLQYVDEQVDSEVQPLEIIEKDISTVHNQQAVLHRILDEDANYIFELEKEWPIRMAVIKLKNELYVISINIHHIAADEWSERNIARDLSCGYQMFQNGMSGLDEGSKPSIQDSLGFQYADYAIWLDGWLQTENYRQAKNYWVDKLQGIPQLHELPTDFQRPNVRSIAGAHYVHVLPKILIEHLNTCCREYSTNIFNLVQSAFAAFLSRYSDNSDIVFGIAADSREPAEFIDSIGLFVNTLVMRYTIDEDHSFADLIGQTKVVNKLEKRYQFLPFDVLVEELQATRSLSFNPLFQIMLVMQDKRNSELKLEGVEVTPLNHRQQVAKLDLTLNVSRTENDITCTWEYSQALFTEQRIEQMAGHFTQMLNGLVTAPQQNIYVAPMLSDVEQQQLMIEPNDTIVDYPRAYFIHNLFELQVEQNPYAVAVVCKGQIMSYKDLNCRANQLANFLIEHKQVKPDTLVGICIERSLEMVIGIMAILKAGFAYVPLDPRHPKARLEYLIADSGVSTVLTQRHLLKLSLRGLSADMAVCLDDPKVSKQLDLSSGINVSLPVSFTSHNLAYLIYTSGTTGQPKGVQIEHRNTVAMLSWALKTFDMHQLRAVCASSSICFDLSVFEIFAPLSAGGTVYIVDDLPDLVEQDFSKTITLINTVPSVAEVILKSDIDLTSLNTVNLAGEPLRQSLVDQLYQKRVERVYDLYGPSEDTTYSTFALREVNGTASIGKPIDNTQVYILNRAKQLVPNGVIGELYLGGHGLSRGYLNQPSLTAEKFIENPFVDVKDINSSQRLYKTGDLVRWQAGLDGSPGQLIYLGRTDHQVKIRGFRIELGEIEHHLVAHDEVESAIVLVKDSLTNDKTLVAYVVTEHSERLNTKDEESVTQTMQLTESLRQALMVNLPDYMLPSAFMWLDKLPLTQNGKVDRQALLDLRILHDKPNYVAPTTEMEHALCEIWQQVLNVEKVSATDDFFQLGGHSLMATIMIGLIRQQLNIDLPIRLVFSHSTIDKLAAELADVKRELHGPSLIAVSREGQLVMSYSQQRLWFINQLAGTDIRHNRSKVLKLSGELNIDALQMALNMMIKRHEILRTVFFTSRNGEIGQHILDISQVTMEQCSSSNDTQKIATAHAAYPFDLSMDIMLQVKLVKVSTTEYLLLLNLHYIAADDRSMDIFINELSVLYKVCIEGGPDPLSPLPIQYADYAHCQRNWLKTEVLKQLLGYWQQQLSELPTVHNLPLDKSRPAEQSFNAATFSTQLDITSVRQLEQVCQSVDATTFMGLHAVFSGFLSRYSNATDIVVGSPVDNREQPEIAGLIGLFSNTLVLRSDLSENPSFTGLLKQSRQMLLDAYKHKQVPFEQLVEALQPERVFNLTPLFQIMLVFRNKEESSLKLTGIKACPVEPAVLKTRYDLTLIITESEQGLLCDWEYNIDLFTVATIEKMAGHFAQLLNGFVTAPHQRVLAVPILSDAEQQLLFDANNKGIKEYPKAQFIHQLFEQQATITPDAVALVFEKQKLSYKELNEQSNQLAHYLIERRQVSLDTLVGICVERSPHMLIGILAILKAGGAYVPLDPSYPPVRLDYIINDASLSTVLTQQHLHSQMSLSDEMALCLDDNHRLAEFAKYSSANIPLSFTGLTSEHLAYVIYTSGSTGQPKGVMTEHHNGVALLSWSLNTFDSHQLSAVWSLTSMSFAMSFFDFFTPLSAGGTLYIAADVHIFDQLDFAKNITLINISPSAVQAVLLSDGNLIPETVICTGEMLPGQLVDQLFQKGAKQVYSIYGSTETTVASTFHKHRLNEKDFIIGNPIDNTQVYIFNGAGQLVPHGVAGELHIGGDGLSRGYLNRSDLTAEKFIANPFYGLNDINTSVRLYKTGDLVCWQAGTNGQPPQLMFLGRMDNQIKIRGFQVELVEIENQLCQLSQVSQAVVLGKSNSRGDGRLVGYIVCRKADVPVNDQPSIGSPENIIESIRQQLNQLLPEYMIPSGFVLLESIPLTANGKVDRRALSQLDEMHTAYAAPVTDTEKALCEIWKDILSIEQISTHDDFFELGGDSIDVTSMASRIHKLGATVSFKQILETPTIAGLATAIDSSRQLEG